MPKIENLPNIILKPLTKELLIKTYLALTNNSPKKNDGIIDYPLEIKNKNIANDIDKSQEALTYFKIKSSNPDRVSLIELSLIQVENIR